MKKVYQEIKVHSVDLLNGRINIENKYSFIGLDDFEMYWEITKDGVVIQSGEVENINIKPKYTKEFKLGYNISQPETGAEYHLLISLRLRIHKLWAEEGYELAWEQFKIPVGTGRNIINPVSTKANLSVEENEKQVFVKSNDFSEAIGRESGGIESLNFGFGELIVSPLVPNYWRALTDNDIGYANFEPRYEWLLVDRSWKKSSKCRKIKNITVNKEKHQIRITVMYKVRKAAGNVCTEYIVGADSTVSVENTITPTKDMYRIGMQMALSKEYNMMTWYGRGPHETYADRKTGAKVGIYSGSVKEIIHNYMRPQENGNRTDVRWAALTDVEGKGIKFEYGGGELLNVSIWPYSMEDLEKAKHINELPERDYVSFNIDYCQCGVSGDLLPGVAGVHYEYRIHKGRTYKYSFLIKGLYDGLPV